MGRLRLQLPNPVVVGGRAEIVIVLQKRHQMKSAAAPKLGDYTQWMRLRAPTKGSTRIIRRRKPKTSYMDGGVRLQEGLVAVLEGLRLYPELGLDITRRLVQGARPAPVYPTHGCGAGRLGVGDRRAGSADFLRPRR